MEPLILAIIEDEEAHFNLMKRAIVRSLDNVSVCHFAEPQSCLESLAKTQPTIIITDYLMPGMNGIELIAELNQKKLDVPVIMITGQGDEIVAAHAMKLGAKDYLVKSDRFFDLLPRVIEKVINEKKTSDALKKMEKRYRLVVENANEGIIVIQDGRLALCNPKTTEITGYSELELIDRPLMDFVYPADRQLVLENHNKGPIGHKEPEIFEFRIIDKNHDIKWIRTHEVFAIWENKPTVLNFLTDITALKQADEHIRTLSQMLLQAQERERKIISYELHDHILQKLTFLKIACDMLFDGQPDISPELKSKSKNISTLSQQIISDIRNLAYGLRPPFLEELGLEKAIEKCCNDMVENSGIDIEFQSAGMHAFNLDIDTQIHLYRLVQEGLNNIRKHASADKATIKLLGAFPNIILRIEDNGKGFDVDKSEPASDSEKRMGLRSMLERVNLHQGQMTIQSQAEHGTRILIKIPLRTENDNKQERHPDH